MLSALLACSPAEAASLRLQLQADSARQRSPPASSASHVAQRLSALREALPPGLDVRRLALSAPSLLALDAAPPDELAASFDRLQRVLYGGDTLHGGPDAALLCDAVVRTPALLDVTRAEKALANLGRLQPHLSAPMRASLLLFSPHLLEELSEPGRRDPEDEYAV